MGKLVTIRTGYTGKFRGSTRAANLISEVSADSVPTRPLSKREYAQATQAALCIGAKAAMARTVNTHQIIKRGKRYFAEHTLSLTDRIAARSQKRGNWQDLPGTSTRARLVRNFT